MPRLVVSDLHYAHWIIQKGTPLSVLSFVDPGSDSIPELGGSLVGHQKLEIRDTVGNGDTDEMDFTVPNHFHAQHIVRFAQGWDGRSDTLIRCREGRSRSAAAALVFLYLNSLNSDPIDTGLRLRNAGPWLQPNRRILQLCEEVLGNPGDLLIALGAMRGATQKGVTGPAIIPLQRSRHPGADAVASSSSTSSYMESQ